MCTKYIALPLLIMLRAYSHTSFKNYINQNGYLTRIVQKKMLNLISSSGRIASVYWRNDFCIRISFHSQQSKLAGRWPTNSSVMVQLKTDNKLDWSDGSIGTSVTEAQKPEEAEVVLSNESCRSFFYFQFRLASINIFQIRMICRRYTTYF